MTFFVLKFGSGFGSECDVSTYNIIKKIIHEIFAKIRFVHTSYYREKQRYVISNNIAIHGFYQMLVSIKWNLDRILKNLLYQYILFMQEYCWRNSVYG